MVVTNPLLSLCVRFFSELIFRKGGGRAIQTLLNGAAGLAGNKTIHQGQCRLKSVQR